MATIHQCSIKHISPRTTACREMNQGKRAKCKGCGSMVQAVVGHAIVAPWRGDGRYSLGDAVREFRSVAAADRFASDAYKADNQSTLVSRFILA